MKDACIEAVIEQDKQQSSEYKYWKLCSRIIPYMNKVFPDISINITKFGFEIDLDIFPKFPYNGGRGYNVQQSFSSYESVYERLIEYRRKEHFISKDMSPEEVDLQLSIRGY